MPPTVWARHVTIWLHVLQGFGGAEATMEGQHGHWSQHVRTTQGRGRKVSVSGPNVFHAGFDNSTPLFWALPRPTHTSNHNLVSIPRGGSVSGLKESEGKAKARFMRFCNSTSKKTWGKMGKWLPLNFYSASPQFRNFQKCVLEWQVYKR